MRPNIQPLDGRRGESRPHFDTGPRLSAVRRASRIGLPGLSVLSDRVVHPLVGLDVDAFVACDVDLDRDDGAGDRVAARARELESLADEAST
jgi:hypothetical protein